MSDLAGRVLAGRFELVRLLDEAEEASLYEAVQLDVGRRVAVKVLAEGRDEADAARLRQEAYAMATIDDPHVAKVLEIGGGEGTGEPTFVVMERRTGETLDGKGPMTAERVVHVGVQIAHALDAAHAVGIIHRDVRPSNVSLVRTAADDAFVELTGFGLAKALNDDDGAKTKTLVAARRTRDRFTPPEGNARDVASATTDIFGAGECLKALLGATPDAALARIIEKATAMDPKARYASAAELKAALKAWKPSVAEPHAKPQTRRRSLTPFVAAAVLSTSFAIAVVVLIVRDRKKQGPAPPTVDSAVPAPSASVVESEIVPEPSETAEPSPVPSASASVPPSQVAKAPRPPRGSFDLVSPLVRVPPAEGEAWRVATTKKLNACIKQHGLGECDVKELSLTYFLTPDGKVSGRPASAYDADAKECSLPAPLSECLAKVPDSTTLSKPTMKSTTAWVESWNRARRVD